MLDEKVQSQLQHADRSASAGRIAASMVHDIGTPLTVITGRASLIIEGETNLEKVRESAERILDQAHRISEMFRRFLEFARRAPVRERVSLLAIARNAIELMSPMAKKVRMKLAITAESEDVEAELDPGQILHVLVDLLTNAIEAMPEGRRATIAVSRWNAVARVSVADDGPGVPEGDRERVFEPFFTTRATAAGLGLCVARSIVESHGGTIELTSAPSGGACFTFSLPIEGVRS